MRDDRSIDDVYHDARHALMLVQWIVEARNVVEDLDLAARHHPDLKALLEKYEVGGYGVSWGKDEQEGLLALILDAQHHTLSLKRQADAAQASTVRGGH